MNIVKSEWENNTKQISINESFLQYSNIKNLMFCDDDRIFFNEIIWLEKNYLSKLNLLENPSSIGNPDFKIYNGKMYNSNDIHHAYHILKYNSFHKFEEQLDILEWGGGYGNFYKVLNLLFPDIIKSYTVIDLHECLDLQKYYLNKLNLLNNVYFISSEELINNDFQLPNSNINLFISTWAISESPTYCFDWLKNKNFYNANRFLISLHQCGYHIPFMEESSYIFNYFNNLKYHSESINFIPGKNYYLFK